MKAFATTMTIMVVLAASLLHGAGFEMEMQDEWSLRLSHPDVGDICTNSRLSIIDLSDGSLAYYTRMMGSNCHENVPENRPGISRLIQYTDAMSRSRFILDDYSARLADDNGSVTLHIAGHMVNGTMGSAEYAALCVPKHLADGCSFTAKKTDGTTVKEDIPEQDGHNWLASDCKRISLHMKVGTLDIQVVDGEPLELLDRRLSGYERGKCLFIGLVGRNMETPLDNTIRVSFTPDPNAHLIKPLETQPDAVLVREAIAFRPVKRDYPVDTQCIVPKVMKEFGDAPETEWKTAFAQFPPLPAEDRRRLEKAVSRLGKLPTPLTLLLTDANDVTWKLPEDGFTIDRDDNAICIAGATPRAIFYGIQTLRDVNLKRKFHLEDWPDMAFRGNAVWLFPWLSEGDELDCPLFFLNESWSRAHINYLVFIRCAEYQWNTIPELWQLGNKERWPDKGQIKRFIDECRDNYIEPIPCIPLLSHAGWFFQNGQHLDLAEDPSSPNPYNYNVNDPRVYEIVEPLLDEIIDLFKPAYVHIGHDEVTFGGTLDYPTRPENKQLGKAELYRRSVTRLHDFLASRGVKTMLWGDSMMATYDPITQGDIKTFRATLPNDLVVMVWNYNDGKQYGEMKDLQDEGFTVVGCPWYSTNNIRNMVDAAKQYKIWGVCGTTWWPMHVWDYVCQQSYPYQMPAQLSTACLSWGGPTQKDVSMSRYADIIYGLVNKHVALDDADVAEGYCVDLSPIANYLPQKGSDPILGADFTDVFKGGELLPLGRGTFKIPQRDGQLAAIAMQNFPQGTRFPAQVDLPVTGRLASVHLLGALTAPVQESHFETKSLGIVFHYDDGETVERMLSYNNHIGHVHGHASYALNPTTCLEGLGGRLWDNVIKNPQPDKAVASLSLVSYGQGFVLFGVSCEQIPDR